MQPFLQPAMLPELAGLPCVLFGKHQGTQRRPSQAWILIFKAPLKKALLWGFGGFTPPKKKSWPKVLHMECVFFFFFWVLVVEDSDFYTFARVLVKSWTWERNWSRGVPEKRDTMVDPAKKKYGMAKRGVFWIFSSTPFFLKMYSSFVPSCLRFWWMGWWGGSLEKDWMRISQQWDF